MKASKKRKLSTTSQSSYANEYCTDGLSVYDVGAGDDQEWVTISEIVVPTEYDKEQLLKAFRYIHYLHDIDPDYMAVNTIMHLYQCPELIKVKTP